MGWCPIDPIVYIRQATAVQVSMILVPGRGAGILNLSLHDCSHSK